MQPGAGKGMQWCQPSAGTIMLLSEAPAAGYMLSRLSEVRRSHTGPNFVSANPFDPLQDFPERGMEPVAAPRPKKCVKISSRSLVPRQPRRRQAKAERACAGADPQKTRSSTS